MNLSEINNFFNKNKIIIIFLLVIIILIVLLYKRENLETVTKTSADKYILANSGMIMNDINMVLKKETSNNTRFKPICFNDTMIFYINNNQDIRYKRLNDNGTPFNEQWNTCTEGKIWSIAANNSTLYGMGTDRELYTLPITTSLQCKGWKDLGNDDIQNITPTDNSVFISRSLSESYYLDSNNKWNKSINIGDIKYDKSTKKLWGRNQDGLSFSTNNFSTKKSLTNSQDNWLFFNYDVYDDNLFGFKITANKSEQNIFKYKKIQVENVDTHILSPFDKIDSLKDICVTKNYVFTVDASNNLYVALVNDKATKTLIDADSTKFKKHLTFDKTVEKLYSHPTCLYILFTDNTFGYIPLEKTDDEIQKQFSSDLAAKSTELSKLSIDKDTLQKQVLELTDELNKTKKEALDCSSNSIELSKTKAELENKIKDLTLNIEELNKKISEKENDMKNRLKSEYDNKSKSDCDNRVTESLNRSKTDCDNRVTESLNRSKTDCDSRIKESENKLKDIQTKLDEEIKSNQKLSEGSKDVETLKQNNNYLIYANIGTCVCCCIIVLLAVLMGRSKKSS